MRHVGRAVALALVAGVTLVYIAGFAAMAGSSRDFIVERDNAAARSKLAASGPLSGEVAFGANSVGARSLGAGWNKPERDGVWSHDREAWLYLRVAPGHAVTLTISGAGYVSTRHPAITVSALVNGLRFNRWDLDQSGAGVLADLEVDAAHVRDGILEIELDTDEPASPYRLGDSPDVRWLGFYLDGILVEEDSSAP